MEPLRLPTRLTLVALTICAAAVAVAAPPNAAAATGPSEDAMRAFLQQGKWSVEADDNKDFTGEALEVDFARSLVAAYRANPKDANAIANLSLIPLALAVAEWGIAPSDGLPPDPVKKGWAAVSSTGDGKHLMSYSKGGIGVMHQDSGGLAKLFAYLEANHPDVVPTEYRNDFFRLKGVNFDKLYAAGGHCTRPVSEIETDLAGAKFQHTISGYAGDGYCKEHNRPELKLTPRDWQVFRHGMREALRREDVQFRVLRDFAANEWAKSYDLAVIKNGRDVREAFVLARIWNSAGGLAQCAFGKAEGVADTASRIQEELEAYANGCQDKPRMKERWPYMQRAVVLYDALAKN